MKMPTPQTKQASAIAGANALISVATQFAALRAQCADLVKQYNSEGWNTVWNAMATAAVNTDGSLGTADGSPNVAHPIDTRQFNTLVRDASATQLIAMVTFLGDFANFLGNAAVSTAQRSQTIDDLAD